MDLSIIICTWNNCRRLALTLDALPRCVVPGGLKWELIVVNNNSTDTTDATLRAFLNRLPLRIVEERRQGLSFARNAGIRAAAGNLLIFTDDDVTPSEEWIAIYYDAFQRFDRRCFFGGPIGSEYESSPPAARLLAVAPYSVRGFDLGNVECQLDEDRVFLSANWACPRDILNELHGFDEARGLGVSSGGPAAGEEHDLMMRLKSIGWFGIYLPSAYVRHFVPASKCTLTHIAARHEEGAFAAAPHIRVRLKRPLICGIPLAIWKAFVASTVKYCASLTIARPDPVSYVGFRAAIGYMRGFRYYGRLGELQNLKLQED